MITLAPAAPPIAPPAQRDARPLNVLSIDVEEWFQVTNFSAHIRPEEWNRYPLRIQECLPRLLDLLAEYSAHATFFALGWVAQRFPLLMRRIVREGHELATHGDEHRLVTDQTPEEFRAQLLRSVDILQQAAGVRVAGHRAPTYSFRKETIWAIQVMLECGLKYDSSIYPFGVRRVPELCDKRFPCWLDVPGQGMLAEYPLSTWRVSGRNIPIAGGGYFRFFPYPFVKRGMERVLQEGGRIITYFHPWEIDSDQPRVAQASFLERFRHYYDLKGTEQKLRRMLTDFRFGSFRDVYWSQDTRRYEIVPQR